MSLIWMLPACPPEEKDTTSDAPPINQDTEPVDCAVAESAADACEAEQSCEAPIITGVQIVNGGMVTFDNGTYPTVAVRVDVEDGDGDLHSWGMDVWYDAELDGSVDTSGEPTPSSFAPEVNACAGYLGTGSLGFGVSGSPFAYDTPYEFTVRVEDAFDTVSDFATASGYTPKSDGSDGG